MLYACISNTKKYRMKNYCLRLIFITSVLFGCKKDDAVTPNSFASGVYVNVDNNLLQLNESTGSIANTIEINGFPSGEKHSGMTFDNVNNVFYLIRNTTTDPTLIKITGSANYEVVGQIKLNGAQVDIGEALAFDSDNEKLYVSASLNGGVSDGDFWSESILTLDVKTAEATLITTIITSNINQSESDTDDMHILDGVLYLTDSAPPGANFTKVYTVNWANLVTGGNTSPTEIYAGTHVVGARITVNNDDLFVSSERSLSSIDLNSPSSLNLIGATHTESEFKGKTIVGITYVKSSQTNL